VRNADLQPSSRPAHVV